MTTLNILSAIVTIISGLAITITAIVGLVPKFRHKALKQVATVLDTRLKEDDGQDFGV